MDSISEYQFKNENRFFREAKLEIKISIENYKEEILDTIN